MSKKANENQMVPIMNRPVKDWCQSKYLHLLTNTCMQQMGQKGQCAPKYCEWRIKSKIYGEQKDEVVFSEYGGYFV